MSSARVSSSVTRVIITKQLRCMHMLPCSILKTTAVALINRQTFYYCCIVVSGMHTHGMHQTGVQPGGLLCCRHN
jgi:hypothetical protein